jgi:hypothetical protein
MLLSEERLEGLKSLFRLVHIFKDNDGNSISYVNYIDEKNPYFQDHIWNCHYLTRPLNGPVRELTEATIKEFLSIPENTHQKRWKKRADSFPQITKYGDVFISPNEEELYFEIT